MHPNLDSSILQASHLAAGFSMAAVRFRTISVNRTLTLCGSGLRFRRFALMYYASVTSLVRLLSTYIGLFRLQ